MEEFVSGNLLYATTLPIKELFNKPVLTHTGIPIGRVQDVRLNEKTIKIEGIVVSRTFKDALYIGNRYFQMVSRQSIILSIEPTVLFLGKRVLTSEGKILGKIKQITRVSNTNEIHTITVKSLFRKPFVVKRSDIQSTGDSFILKKNYNASSQDTSS